MKSGLELRMPGTVWLAVMEGLADPDGREGAGYLLGRMSSGVAVIGKAVFPSEGDYLVRTRTRVEIDPEFGVRTYMDFLDSDNDVLVNVHNHTFREEGGPRFSAVDDADDQVRLGKEPAALSDSKRARGKPGGVVAVSMVLDPDWNFEARASSGGETVPVTRLSLTGRHIEVKRPSSTAKKKAYAAWPDPIESGFGAIASEAMAGVRVALVGCGGIGSVVAETLLRSGIRDLALVDGDAVEEPNLPRLQGAAPGDVGRNKAEWLAGSMTRCFPDAAVRAVATDCYSDGAILALSRADAVVCAADNAAARAFVSRFAASNRQVLLDGAAQVTDSMETLAAPMWRVTAHLPGITACGDCSPKELFFRAKAAAAEFGDPEILAASRARGYFGRPATDGHVSVYSLNQACAAAIGMELRNVVTFCRGPAHHLSNVGDFLVPYRTAVRICSSQPEAARGGACPVCGPDSPVGLVPAFPERSGRAVPAELRHADNYLAETEGSQP